MDLDSIWDINDENATLNPWPDALEEAPGPNMTQQNEVPALDEPIRAVSPLEGIFDTDMDDSTLGQARWTGAYFNKPAGVEEQMPPLLMSTLDMELTRMAELYRIHSAGFELKEGDTLVFIDYPSPLKPSMSLSDCNGIVYKSQKFRVHSQNLIATNSSKFAEMFGPTYQFRIMRRRKLVNNLPEGIKYVLDLTPPSEGDELVFQMTELSLTPGIIKWWSSAMIHEVDPWLVCGHDDVCKCGRLLPLPPAKVEVEEPETPTTETRPASSKKTHGLNSAHPFHPDSILQMKARGENDLYETPHWRQIQDYCSIRHRNGIIRLLMLLEGKPAILDSAARVWTMVKLCKIFDCTDVIRDRAAQWVMHGHNTRFIEVLPEDALRIAFDLQLPQIAQAAFRILVNELALKEADSGNNLQPQTTIFGRKLGDLPDELGNLVQHAARAFLERISGTVGILQNKIMFDCCDMPEWVRLRGIEELLASEGTAAEFALNELRELMSALTHEVINAVNLVISNDIALNDTIYTSLDEDRATYVKPRDFERQSIIMKQLNPVQLFLCSTPYNELGMKLGDKLFLGNRSKTTSTKGVQFDSLVIRADKALRRFQLDNPAVMSTEAWRQLFNILTPTRFFKNEQIHSVVDLPGLQARVLETMRLITLSWIRQDIEPPLNITRHLLLMLSSDEMKFLPLWAGGCDDGTGGVFEEPIPPTDMGPSGPGPSFHTGLTIPSQPSSIAGSMIEDLAEMRLRGSQTAASVDAHDSISTVYRPDRVIADDVSVATETFTAGASEYQAARFEIPADNQSMGSAVNLLVESTDSEAQSSVADREMTPEADDDDDMGFWGESDSDDDSVVLIQTEH